MTKGLFKFCLSGQNVAKYGHTACKVWYLLRLCKYTEMFSQPWQAFHIVVIVVILANVTQIRLFLKVRFNQISNFHWNILEALSAERAEEMFKVQRRVRTFE